MNMEQWHKDCAELRRRQQSYPTTLPSFEQQRTINAQERASREVSSLVASGAIDDMFDVRSELAARQRKYGGV